jgi:uncharacterized protein YjiS (DUF1127 family)
MIYLNDSRPEHAEIMARIRLARAQAVADALAGLRSGLARLGRGLWSAAAGTAAAIGRWRRERATMRELMALDDHMLKDIGLSRSMIRGIAAGVARAPVRPEPVRTAVADDNEAALAAHRLRTPLTAIRGFSEILRDNPGLAPEQRDAFFGIVIAESERLDRAIDTVNGPNAA